MTTEAHYRKLESMYQAAPINQIYRPTMTVSDSAATIEIELSEQLHHSGGGVHGSVYFKMLDDAAFFAANSLEPTVFVLTATFTTNLKKPVAAGTMKAIGRVTEVTQSKIMAEAVVFNSDGEEIGNGHGVFVRSKFPLTGALGYSS